MSINAVYEWNYVPTSWWGHKLKNNMHQGEHMPLRPGKSRTVISSNVREMVHNGYSQNQAVAAALETARKARADGGAMVLAHGGAPKKMFSGPVNGHGPGRTDRYPLHVSSGSYVIPADIVSALGEGNTAAGNEVIRRMFFKDAPLHREGNRSKMMSSPVPVIVAGGEYIIPPDVVETIGDGDVAKGHSILDAFVKSHRKKTVKHLKSLPGPVKN